MSTPNLASLVLAAGLAATAGARAAAAPACFELSPLREQLGETYYDVDIPRSQLPDLPTELDRLARNIAGPWRGESVGFDCRGTDGNPRQVRRNVLIEATIADTAAAGLVIDVTRENPDQRVTTQDRVVLFDPDMLLSFQVAGPYRAVGSQRFRQATAEGLSLMRQTDTTIELRDNRLTLNLHYFVNGVFVGQETWDLSRP
ncbi:MAG: hypothetical protein VX663_01450 [Pseudomonadota bacterium]|nr:hypothetical protein [Pseudomonadota bacterium]